MAKDMVKVMSVIATKKATNATVTKKVVTTNATVMRINHGFEVFSRQDLFLTKECTGVLD